MASKELTKEIWSPSFLGYQYLLKLNHKNNISFYMYKDKNFSIVVTPPTNTGCSCSSTSEYDVEVITKSTNFYDFGNSIPKAFKNVEKEVKQHMKCLQSEYNYTLQTAKDYLLEKAKIEKVFL